MNHFVTLFTSKIKQHVFIPELLFLSWKKASSQQLFLMYFTYYVIMEFY